MAFETGTATDLDDLFDKLITFAVANGWTEDEDETNDHPAIHRGDCYVQWRYDGSSPPTNRTVAMYQALGYISSGTNAGAQTDDSGNGVSATSPTDAAMEDQRCISDMGDGPFPGYWFFEDDTTAPYIHVVVEVRTEEYRHFGFGTVDKFGDWTGGEYAYGHYWAGAGHGTVAPGNTALLDGLFSESSATNQRRGATLHVEGLPGQDAAGKWGQVWGRTGSRPNDRAGEDKVWIQGGFRSGPVARIWGNFSGSSADGLVPMYQIALFYVDDTNDHAYYLGTQLDVRGINIRNFAPKEEITVGSDTWVVFPTTIRSATTTVALSSAYSGIAYRKVT